MCLHGWWVEVWVWPAELQPETRRGGITAWRAGAVGYARPARDSRPRDSPSTLIIGVTSSLSECSRRVIT
eukprot:3506066-Prymnesium_polylepis.1